MIESMTGYGGAQRAEDGTTYVLDLKSVNHRYLKLALKLPDLMQFAESTIEKLLRARLARGSVSYTLRVRSDANLGLPTLDVSAMQCYVDQLARVRLPAQTAGTIDLGALATLPGVCQSSEVDDSTRARQLAVVQEVTKEALDALVRMRQEEGQALQGDLLDICRSMRTHLAEVAARAPMVIEEYHERLRSRVESLLKSASLELEADGLMREVAIFADRCDITEEVARLESHLNQFCEICDRKGQVGRTLDFLTQEMLREANTMASKSNDAPIARNVVELKRLIDRLREQVQNVE